MTFARMRFEHGSLDSQHWCCSGLSSCVTLRTGAFYQEANYVSHLVLFFFTPSIIITINQGNLNICSILLAIQYSFICNLHTKQDTVMILYQDKGSISLHADLKLGAKYLHLCKIESYLCSCFYRAICSKYDRSSLLSQSVSRPFYPSLFSFLVNVKTSFV